MCAIGRYNIAAACRRGLALGLLFSCAGLASLIADDSTIWDLIYNDINYIKYRMNDIVHGMSDVIWDGNRNADNIINKLEDISGYTWDVFVSNWPYDNDFAEDITSNVETLNDQVNDLIIALEQNIGELKLQLELEFDSLSLDMGYLIIYLQEIYLNTYNTVWGIDNLSWGIDNLSYLLTSDDHGVHVKNYNQGDLLSGLESIMPGGSEDIIDVFDEWDNELISYYPPDLYEPDLDEFITVSGIVYSAADAYKSVHADALEYEIEGQSVLDDIDFSGDFEDQTLMGNIRSVVDKIMPLPVEISSMYWSLAIPEGVSIFGDVEVIRLVDISASDLQLMSAVRSVSGLIYVALGIFVLVRGLR